MTKVYNIFYHSQIHSEVAWLPFWLSVLNMCTGHHLSCVTSHIMDCKSWSHIYDQPICAATQAGKDNNCHPIKGWKRTGFMSLDAVQGPKQKRFLISMR